MTHVLRTSIGPFSAGTRTQIISDNPQDKTYTVEVKVPEPNKSQGFNYSFEDLVFDIDKDDLVELRNRSDVISSVSRQKRRAFLSQLFAKTQAMQSAKNVEGK